MSNKFRFALTCILLTTWQCGLAQNASPSGQGTTQSGSQPGSQPLSQALSQPLSQPAEALGSQYGSKTLNAQGQPVTADSSVVKGTQQGKSVPATASQTLPPCPFFGVQTHCVHTSGSPIGSSDQNSSTGTPASVANSALTAPGYMQSSVQLPIIRSATNSSNSILHSPLATPTGGGLSGTGMPGNLTEAMSASKSHRNADDGPNSTPGHLTPIRSAAIAPPKPQRVNTSSKSADTQATPPKKKVEACVVLNGVDICN